MRNAVRSILALVAFVTCSATFAGGHVMISDPYVRAVPPGQPNSAAFMTLMNHGDKTRSLVAAKCPAAKVVELHTHTMEEGMMKMRRIDQIDIPAQGSTTLEPGGLHVMLIGLTQDLKMGDKVPVTLVFADGAEEQVEAPVRKIQMMQMNHDMPMKHDMSGHQH
jgi:copper(I)-binding protein